MAAAIDKNKRKKRENRKRRNLGSGERRVASERKEKFCGEQQEN